VTALPADDRLEILALYARYCHASDTNDIDRVAACFAEDCIFESAKGRYEGRAAVRAFAAQLAAEMPGQRHQTTDHLIEPIAQRPDAARGRAYYTFSLVREGRLATVVTGVYENEFAKLGGRWYIQRHLGLPDRS
jgi:uncharacterized protein (TIGR02246 family)